MATTFNAGDIVKSFAILNLTTNTHYMMPSAICQDVMKDANMLLNENICNGDNIALVEITYEMREQLNPISGKVIVKHEIDRSIVVFYTFKYNRKTKTAVWK